MTTQRLTLFSFLSQGIRNLSILNFGGWRQSQLGRADIPVRACHCEERSDEAISIILLFKEIASLRSQRQTVYPHYRTDCEGRNP